MGNNKSAVGIYIKTDKSFYLPGDVVQGSIFINSPQPYPCSKILLNISGIEHSWWKDQLTRGQRRAQRPNQRRKISETDQHKGESKIIQTNFIVCAWNNQSFVHGQYSFPFVFRLPFHIPGSFEQTKPNYKAKIGYQIRCICISPNSSFKHLESIQELVVREPQKQSEQLLYGEIFLYPRSCWFRRHGVAKVSCYFEKNHYMPGEECIVICEVDNFKCTLPVQEIKCEFIKSITLISYMGDQKVFTTTINSIVFPGIGPSSQYVGQNAVRLALPLKYKNSEVSLHPSTCGRYVKCQYYIKVSPLFNGCCVGNEQFFSVKLNIMQVGLLMGGIEEPANWNPEQYKKSEIILNNQTDNSLIGEMIP